MIKVCIFIFSPEASFLAYWPSCIAAAAILHAANEIPNWSLVRPEHAESWCEGLRKVLSMFKGFVNRMFL